MPDTEDTIVYVVRRGDTFDRLSRKYLVPDRDWQALLRLAGIRDPRRLPIGHRLVIPRTWLRYTVEPARLASYRGTVRISFSGRAVAPAAGMALGEGTQLTTAANSFISLVLPDRSTVVIPSQSQVRIRQLRRILLTGTIDYRFEIERGRLETKVTPLEGPAGHYRIYTPLSMTAVRGTEFRVAYDAESALAGTEVLSGTVSFSSASEGSQLTLQERVGAIVDRSGEARVVDLLPAPQLQDPGRVQTRDSVELQTAPLAGAVRYRAVIAADAGFIENIAEQFSDTGSFAFTEIPNGNLFVRVSAVDGNGLEGLAQSYSFSRRLASIRGEVEPSQEGYRFRWSGAGSGARRYHFQLMRGSPDALPTVDEVGLERDSLTLRNLPPDIYYWRVGLTQIENGETTQAWTDPEKLTISGPSTGQGR